MVVVSISTINIEIKNIYVYMFNLFKNIFLTNKCINHTHDYKCIN